jgi:mRNA-degrading endonuclease toxin of MazEF toxin-antitoxin module
VRFQFGGGHLETFEQWIASFLRYHDSHPAYTSSLLNWTTTKLQLNLLSWRTIPIYRYHLYWIDCGINIVSEQNHRRPCVILWRSDDFSLAIVCPLTTKRRGSSRPFHVHLDNLTSTILTEQIRLISVRRIIEPIRTKGKISALNEGERSRLNKALKGLFFT